MAPELSGSTPCVVVVTLGKGGVGKTTTTAKLAASLARLGLPVVAVDAGPGEESMLAVVQGRQAVRASPPSPAVPRKHAPLSLGGFSGLAWEQRTKGEAPGGEAGGARVSSRARPAASPRPRHGRHHPDPQDAMWEMPTRDASSARPAPSSTPWRPAPGPTSRSPREVGPSPARTAGSSSSAASFTSSWMPQTSSSRSSSTWATR